WPGAACRRRSAAVRTRHAVHRAYLPGTGRAPRRDLPCGDHRRGVRGAGQPRGRRRRALRHHGGPRCQVADLRRRNPLLPGRKPGPGRTRRGAGVPRAAHARPRPGRAAAAGRRRGNLRDRQAPDHLVGFTEGEPEPRPRAVRVISSRCSSAASTTRGVCTMQAPVKNAHGRSLNVPGRLPERTPVASRLPERQPSPGLRPGRAPAPVRSRDMATVADTSAAADAGMATRGRRTLMLAVCCMSLFMVGLDNTIVNVGLPAIGADLHAGVSGLQWTVAAYTIVLAALLMFSGAIADRIGRPTIFQVGLSLFTLGSWLSSVPPSLGWLIAFRVLQGVGGSMLNPAALGIITNTFTGRAERARAIGIWDGIFWANIPVGLAAISLTALFVPDSKAPQSRRTDPVGQFLIMAMLGSLAYAIIEGPTHGWYSPEIFGFFALSVAALAVLLAYEPRRAEPMIDLRFFRSVPFAGANLSAVCAIAAMAGFLFLSTLYLQDVRGLSALQAGLSILPMPVVMALCAPLAGRIVAKRGPRVP